MNKLRLLMLLVCCVSICSCQTTHTNQHLEREVTVIRSDADAWKFDVTLIEASQSIPLVSIHDVISIKGTSISPSGHHAYVHFTTVNVDYPDAPFDHVGVILDLDERSEINRIWFPHAAPIEWTVNDDLWYRESRGTGVGEVTLRKLDGTEIYSFMTGGVDLSPGGRFQVIYPIDFLAHPVVITDLSTYEVIYEGYLSGDEERRYVITKLDWSVDQITFGYCIENARDAEVIEAIIALPR